MIRKLFFAACCCLLFGIIRTRAQAPVTDFTASPTAGCGPLSVQFKDASTNGPLFWNWQFGDGQSSSQQNPSHVYNAPGTYDVQLTTRNRNGNNDVTKVGYITVYPFPNARFGSDRVIACAPSSVQFFDQSIPTGTIASWSWDFGDGSTDAATNPVHSYTQPGYYTVGLKVTNTNGCSNTSSAVRYLRIVDGIQPNFAWDQVSTSCSAPFVFNFLNQTAGPGNLTFSWNLGNGANPAASTDTSPKNITYPTPGNYDVTLQIQSSLGCNATLKQTVPLNNTAPQIAGPASACVNTPATFSNGNTPTPLSLTWDFGDGTNSTDASPSKTYTAPGTYTITLTAKYPSCINSTSRTIQVTNPPSPAFTSNSTLVGCQAPLFVHFTNQTTGTGMTWLWDFGDGTTSTLSDPDHTYTTIGNFDVKLTATNTASGCSNTITMPSFVRIQTPTISINNQSILEACTSSTTTPLGANTVSPLLNTNALDGVASYSWSAPGADAPNTSTSPNPTFTYSNPGKYTLHASITTNGGCTVATDFVDYVTIGTPVAPNIQISSNSISNPAFICGRDPVTFSNPVAPLDPMEFKWAWNFGDGVDTFVKQPVIIHSYNSLGDMNVTLNLIHNGCSQLQSIILPVHGPLPGFSYTAICGTTPLQVNFTDTSKPTPFPGNYSASWDFGDGNTLNNVTPGDQTHPYTLPNPSGLNPYTVKLTMTDGACTQTYSADLILGPTPIDFTVPTPFCRDRVYPFVATSPNPSQIKEYSWQLDGGTPSTPSSNPQFSASFTIGSHSITLIVTDVNGCVNTKTNSFTVTGPTASYSSPAGACKNSTVTFTSTSTPYDANPANAIVSTVWEFGDNTQSPTGTHAYADTGFYYPKLNVADASGCLNTATAAFPIHITSPIANFGGPDSFYCPKTPLVFKDSSKGVNLTHSWDYGDGQSDATGIHPFPNNQNYNVTLTVTDQFGCPNSITKTIRIQQPIAAFDISDTTAICIPLQTKFAAHGQFYDSLFWDFGDHTTSTLPNTSHFYNTLDTFYAKLFLRGPGGCFDSATRRVLVLNPNTTTTFEYSPTVMCDSVPAQFNIIPPGYTSFLLNFGDSKYDSSQNTRPFHMYRTPANYGPLLTLEDATGCFVNLASNSGTITVLGSVPFYTIDTHAFCDSSLVNFTDYTFSNDGIVSMTYDFADGSPTATQPAPTGPFSVTHFYNKPGAWLATLRVTTNHSCVETYTDTVRVWQTPHPVISLANAACTGLIQFNGNLTAPLVDPITWSWDFGNGKTSKDRNPSINLASGVYTVKLQTSVPFGCKADTTSKITIQPLPEIKGPHVIETPVGIPAPIPFTYSANVNSWTWTPADHLDCTTCANPSATLVFNQRYQVTVTDENNCVSSDTILIKTICNDKNYFIPNTFSPNGDGVNDYFYPRGSNLYNIQSLRVFNRWGQLVFERRNFPANAANLGWDGTFNGQPAPMDAYVYIAEVICDNAQVVPLRGDVTLVR